MASGTLRAVLNAALTGLLLLAHDAAAAEPLAKLKVATCARTISAGVGVPFAVAIRQGYFKQEGIDVEVMPLPGSIDCLKSVVTRDVDLALASVEPLAITRPQGIHVRYVYTAYQLNVYGVAVPAESPIKTVADLKGKSIGVTNMASAGVIVARALAALAGLSPDRDINIVVAGEGAQPAILLRNRQVDALSQFDTQYALVENAGVKLRKLATTTEFTRYPSNGFIALEDTIKSRRKDAVGLGRGYAKGTVFAMANPEAAIRIMYEVFPQTRPTGKDETTAVREDMRVLEARQAHMQLEPAGVTRWGENSETNYNAYLQFLLKWGVIKEKVEARDLLTNELIDDINRFDPAAVTAEAKAYRPGR